ncbi:PH domain-containing protein [[Bacillus] enclensis]|uniref:PH domain-containing protein n=1 Tax=[Bacillus] enclensis TaxID=1402860 RepID=UPI0018DE19F4|nr:PH domain-containing protein [[Bacillus] enclensis]MBH9965598.1 PH domain-containing protein [[Bacillus] enclensis]
MAKLDKLVKAAQEHLESGEKITHSVLGAYESKIMGKDTVRNGAMLATNQRILFYGKRTFGYDLEVFPYENVSSIEMGKSMMGHHIAFFSSGNKVKMKWINHGDIPGFIAHVKENIGKSPAKAQAVATQESSSAADEIKRFADLRDSGVITEEEFDAKKKQLLGI